MGGYQFAAPTAASTGPFAPSGLTGATAASRYVGGTTSGAPVTGTFAVGDFVIDQTGIIWICATAGSPGTWSPGGSGLELAYAELNADQAAGTITTVAAPQTGLSVTFTAPARSVEVCLTVPTIVHNTAAAVCVFTITDTSSVVVAKSFSTYSGATSDVSILPLLRSHLPRTGANGAYALTPGTSYTFEVQAAATAGTAYMYTYTGTTRPQLWVRTL